MRHLLTALLLLCATVVQAGMCPAGDAVFEECAAQMRAGRCEPLPSEINDDPKATMLVSWDGQRRRVPLSDYREFALLRPDIPWTEPTQDVTMCEYARRVVCERPTSNQAFIAQAKWTPRAPKR